MSWIVLSAILGGMVVGFMAGASPSPTGGNVAAAVSALLLGVLGFKDSSIVGCGDEGTASFRDGYSPC
ncbi:hypothetical protein THII_3342 [Thioploca ingrica]|uniref:Uncharacterized protein n=1 Tax=Thioploca ingrica TaxID=40754 RepID=A0A090AJJ4_9GAMM|nr:hypothetical protein THII_3342 [Thioploca ingrica]